MSKIGWFLPFLEIFREGKSIHSLITPRWGRYTDILDRTIQKKGNDVENKRVTNGAKFILNVWNIGLFAGVWFLFYNNYTFDTHRINGGLITVLIYMFIYTSLCNLYKAHRIASSEIGETVFSQVLSFGIADLILYVECCLVYNRYVNILPGAATALLQIIGTACIVMWTKQFLMKHIPPKKTIIVYGKNVDTKDVEAFQKRLLKKYR